MRFGLWQRVLPSLLVAGAACGDATGPAATLALSTAPHFSGTVARVTAESGTSPEGPYSQYDLWVTVPPATAASVGVVLPLSTPVFVRSSAGAITAAHLGDLRAGDAVEVWDDHMAAYGVVQGPPGAPTYTGTQIVIDR